MEYSFFSLSTLIIGAAYLAAGVVDAICGGGGLLSIPALMASGLPVTLVTGTNQCAALPGTIVAACKYMRSGKVHYRSALCTIPFSALGGLIGARLNLLIPVIWLQRIMLVLVPVLAVITLLNPVRDGESPTDQLTTRQIILRAAVIGLVIGAYQGFYGPGGGMFFIMGFSMLMKLDLLRSSANTRMVATFSSTTALITYALSGSVHWPVAAVAGSFYIIGAYTGSCLAIHSGQKIIKPVVLLVAILLVAKIAVGML